MPAKKVLTAPGKGKVISVDRRRFLAAAVAAGGIQLAGSKLSSAADKGTDVAAEQRKHAHELHRDSIVIVIHDHNPVEPDLGRMLEGGVTAKVYQLGVDVDIGPKYLESGTIRADWSKRALAGLDEVDALAKTHADRMVIAKTAEDIVKAKQEGKVAIILGVEGAKLLDGKLEMLKMFYDRGLRELQLRWAVPNQIVEQETLTDFGRQVVRECGRLGVVMSLTHIPTTAFHQAIALVEKPPIVCHGIAARAPERRGDWLGDRELRALAGVKGVVGLHFYTSYLGSHPAIERVVEQVDYIANLVGIDTVGLGVDFFPTDGAWGDFQRAQGTKEIAWAIPDIGHIYEVTEGLAMRNYSDEDIKKVLGGNFLRVCKDVFGK